MRFLDIAVICVLLAANILTWMWSDQTNIELLTRENGTLENAQHLLIALSLFALFCGLFRLRDAAAKTAAVALTALCFIMLIRELDKPGTFAPDWFHWTTFAPQRDILFISALLLVVGYLFLQRRHLNGWKQLFMRPQALPLYACGAFLSIGFVLDIAFVTNAHGRLWEEMFELNAHVLLLIYAVQGLALTGLPNLDRTCQKAGGRALSWGRCRRLAHQSASSGTE